MIKPVDCVTCKTPHFDHWECGDCGYDLGFVRPAMNYCPNCGGKLTKRAADLLKRQREHRAALVEMHHKIAKSVGVASR